MATDLFGAQPDDIFNSLFINVGGSYKVTLRGFLTYIGSGCFLARASAPETVVGVAPSIVESFSKFDRSLNVSALDAFEQHVRYDSSSWIVFPQKDSGSSVSYDFFFDHRGPSIVAKLCSVEGPTIVGDANVAVSTVGADLARVNDEGKR